MSAVMTSALFAGGYGAPPPPLDRAGLVLVGLVILFFVTTMVRLGGDVAMRRI